MAAFTVADGKTSRRNQRGSCTLFVKYLKPGSGATECRCNHSGWGRCSPDVVQMSRTHSCKQLWGYFNSVFAPYILRQLEAVKRLDIVWGILYKDDSLKKAGRGERGSGQRKKVPPSIRIPSDWKRFWRADNNKDELFKCLATKVCAY